MISLTKFFPLFFSQTFLILFLFSETFCICFLRELLKGPLYYACTITFSTSIFWRTSPIAIAAICNLCAGDGKSVNAVILASKYSDGRTASIDAYMSSGVADIVGRRFGRKKLPYNPNKSFAGSIAMVLAGFLSSIG